MKIHVVDDDRALVDLLAFTFKREGYDVLLSEDGVSALQDWQTGQPDLVILDVNLPGLDGFSVCQSIREKADTPIIFLSVRSSDEDVVKGLNLGADGYVSKPFSPRQLAARVRALLRRSGHDNPETLRRTGKIRLDLKKHTLILNGETPVKLTRLEYRLLECLIEYAGQPVSAGEIGQFIWGAGNGGRHKVRGLVKRLREKMDIRYGAAALIVNTPGKGYSLPPNLV